MKWPQGWREVLLSDVIESAQPGFAQRPGEEDEGSTPQIRTHNVSPDGRITLEGIKHVTVAEGDLERYRLISGDVVFNNTNSEEWVGKTAVFDQDAGVFVYSNHMTRIRVRRELLLPEFLATYLHFLWSAGYARNRAKRWVSQAAIDVPTLLKFKLPLPPLPEQQRIVEVLREADLRRFQDAADRAEKLRQALVASALSRKLTPTWRKNDESQNWRELLLSEVIESVQPGFAQRPGEEDEGSTPQIRTHNVTPEGRISLHGIKHVRVAEGDFERYRLLPGDVIFNNTNSEEWVGKTAIFDQIDGVFVYSNHMTRIRVRQNLLLPEFLATYLHFLWAAGYARNRAKRWVSQAAIDVPTLMKFKVLLPPLAEQQHIVDLLRQVDGRVFADAIDQGTRLQSALITEALSGRLTAAWREQHAQALTEAARERDTRLGVPAPKVTVQFTEHAPAERRTDLARPRRQALIEQLSSFQHEVWNTLRFEWRGAVLADDPAAFEEFCTSPQTAWRLEGFAAGREEVRRALEQLAAMGLIRKMSLPRLDPNTGRTEYLTAFRPLREAEDGTRAEEDTALADAERLARELERRRAPEAH
jgi:type I restriction enzyme S subunit